MKNNEEIISTALNELINGKNIRFLPNKSFYKMINNLDEGNIPILLERFYFDVSKNTSVSNIRISSVLKYFFNPSFGGENISRLRNKKNLLIDIINQLDEMYKICFYNRHISNDEELYWTCILFWEQNVLFSIREEYLMECIFEIIEKIIQNYKIDLIMHSYIHCIESIYLISESINLKIKCLESLKIIKNGYIFKEYKDNQYYLFNLKLESVDNLIGRLKNKDSV